MKLSVIIPSYNESATLLRCVAAVYEKNPGRDMEVILVDDGSTDDSAEIAQKINFPGFKYLRHKKNMGKGMAVRTALRVAQGEMIIIQDADLENDPADYANVLAPIESGRAQVVYGSRTLNPANKKSFGLFYWGGRLVSFWTNLLYGSHITDEATCYKAFKAGLLKSLNLKCERFEFCAEVTAKILRKKIPICEVPISYAPRSLKEGKKIRYRDGIKTLWWLLKVRLSGEP
ncbi:MAG: glycosyltransferase family 2 protein [Elusimicrobia bacterium]|nr:glycosyltransferase family 2 protein [Elusimicrobiota bacterium]